MTTKLVSKNDVKRALKIRGPFGDIAALTVMSLLGFNKINKKYSNFASFAGREFTTEMLKEFKVKYDFIEKELDYIPQEGPFIVVANHPFGAVDGVILLNIISSIRPDVKFLTNFILSHIPNLKEFFLPVNPFEDKPGLKSSFSGLRMASETLASGGCLVLFPAGEVATRYKGSVIEDKEWQTSVIKLVKNAKVPVIPVYFHGTNSNFFHWLGKIHPMLRTARLPMELVNKAGAVIPVRIGKPVTVNEISEYKDLKDLGRYLKSRCYAMEANIRKPEELCTCKSTTPIALPKNNRLLNKEIKSLGQENHLFTTGNYSCYLAEAKSIPCLLHELGRKREEAFRAVGEGTNKSLDTDAFDDYYKHLILWDKHKSKIVGAYRLGFGSEIMPKYGIKGFYSQTLFNYEEGIHNVLSKSIELGRSFVSLEYQKEPLPLVLLIKGLLYSVLNHKDVEYLFGPVSISSWYPMFYRSMIIHYLKEHHSVKDLESQVRPFNPFVPDFNRVSIDDLLRNKMESIEKFDRYMMRLSDNQFRLPTLVKKYLKINAKIINYNVDPDFNYCVDGLVLLDLKQVPRQEILALSKDEKNQAQVLARFGIES